MQCHGYIEVAFAKTINVSNVQQSFGAALLGLNSAKYQVLEYQGFDKLNICTVYQCFPDIDDDIDSEMKEVWHKLVDAPKKQSGGARLHKKCNRVRHGSRYFVVASDKDLTANVM